MSERSADPMIPIARQVATCMGNSGYAFVEDDRIEELAEVLSVFLRMAGIPVHPEKSTGDSRGAG